MLFSVAIAPMVTTAKGAITQSGNAAAQEQFSAKADNVRIGAVLKSMIMIYYAEISLL